MITAKLVNSEALYQKDFEIKVYVYEDGVAITPSSASISIRLSNSSDYAVEDESMTISSNEITYTLSSSYIDDLLEDNIAEIKMIYNSNTYYFNFIFDIVLNRLYVNITDDDLKKYSPEMANQLWSSESNYQNQIEEAFNVIQRDLKNAGQRPYLLIDGSQIRELLIVKTFELIYFDFSKSEDDIFWSKYKDMQEKYSRLIQNMRYKVDTGTDTQIGVDGEATMKGMKLVR